MKQHLGGRGQEQNVNGQDEWEGLGNSGRNGERFLKRETLQLQKGSCGRPEISSL